MAARSRWGAPAGTNPEHLKERYGPDNATIPAAEVDARVGGVRRVCMEVQTPNGPMRMWFTGEFGEIAEPGCLVYTESMCDEYWNVQTSGDMGMPMGS